MLAKNKYIPRRTINIHQTVSSSDEIGKHGVVANDGDGTHSDQVTRKTVWFMADNLLLSVMFHQSLAKRFYCTECTYIHRPSSSTEWIPPKRHQPLVCWIHIYTRSIYIYYKNIVCGYMTDISKPARPPMRLRRTRCICAVLQPAGSGWCTRTVAQKKINRATHSASQNARVRNHTRAGLSIYTDSSPSSSSSHNELCYYFWFATDNTKRRSAVRLAVCVCCIFCAHHSRTYKCIVRNKFLINITDIRRGTRKSVARRMADANGLKKYI